MSRLLFTYRQYLKKRFGKPVAKIPVNAGLSCPNRDGTISSRGCIFCDNSAFSPVAQRSEPAHIQLQLAIQKKNDPAGIYIAYLQPFTNTYANVSRLRDIYESLISHPRVVGLAIGTRPDCISADVAACLHDIAQRTWLSVELGLQSAHDHTLARINRGHTRRDFIKAASLLHRYNIETVAHVILGLPGEDIHHTNETADFCARPEIAGVKLHQCMIIRNTRLHEQYLRNEITTLSLDRYAQMVSDFLARLRPTQHIHRLMADASFSAGLVAPEWSARKTQSLAYIRSFMQSQGITQGCRFTSATSKE